MSVISKTAETNAVSPYFVTALAGPRIGKVRVEKGQELLMTEHQARALLATGALVDDKAKVDDPFDEIARAKAAQEAAEKAAADAKALADKEAADAKAAADKAAAEAKAATDKAKGNGKPGDTTASSVG